MGAVIALAALCFLCCVIGCIGYRDGYFSYGEDRPQSADDNGGGNKPFAAIPPTHPNTRTYTRREHSEPNKTNNMTTSNVVSTIPVTHQSIRVLQKPVVDETNGTKSSKNIIIHMPERLLTGRQVSPKSHERKINNVVNNIGRIVEDAKKRYNGDIPDKVIVKVDENAKPIN